MNIPTAILVTAGLTLGLIGGANAASHSRRHHRTTHHRKMSTVSMSTRRTAIMSHTTSHRFTDGHGPTTPRPGHGVYGGVFSEPTVTNNGQAPGTSH